MSDENAQGWRGKVVRSCSDWVKIHVLPMVCFEAGSLKR